MQNSIAPIDGADLAVTNFSGTDIQAGIAVKLDPTAGNLLGILPLTSSDAGRGFAVTVDKVKAGRPGRVRMLGSVTMLCDGAIAVGGIVKASVATAGREGYALATTAGAAQLGRALTAGVSLGEVIVWIETSTNA